MKKLICVLVVLVMSLSCALGCAESFDAWSKDATLDDLYNARDSINEEISARITNEMESASAQEGKTLREIFPCLSLAKLVRDKAGMVSVDQVPTNKQLESVTELSSYFLESDETINDLTGLSSLSNLRRLDFYGACEDITDFPAELCKLRKIEGIKLSNTSIKSLPDEFCNLVTLESLSFEFGSIELLPSNIGNLTSLKYLTLSYTPISSLPDSICNCTNLEAISLERCPVKYLPENIGNLSSLKWLNISDTNIQSLPASIYNLSLETFNKKGLSIE